MSLSEFEAVNLEDDEELEEEASTSSSSFVVLNPPPPRQVIHAREQQDTSSEVSSLASSFVPAMNSLNLKTEEDDTSWLDVNNNNNNNNNNTDHHQSEQDSSCFSVVDASVIAGFEVLSVGGSTVRACQRCTFHNADEAAFCQCCQAVLVPNPCLDADALLAQQLQNQEEGEEQNESATSSSSSKRKVDDETVGLGGDLLVSDVTCFIQNKTINAHGFTQVPAESLTQHAAWFIDCYNRSPGVITLAYTYTTKTDATMHRIFQSGFGSQVTVTQTRNRAFGSGSTPNLPAIAERPSGFHSWFRLGNNAQPMHPMTGIDHGWIVAILQRNNARAFVPSCNNRLVADPLLLSHEDPCLPLVCFEGSLIRYDFVEKIRRRLDVICNRFFAETWPLLSTAGELKDEHGEGLYFADGLSPKRQKVEPDPVIDCSFVPTNYKDSLAKDRSSDDDKKPAHKAEVCSPTLEPTLIPPEETADVLPASLVSSSVAARPAGTTTRLEESSSSEEDHSFDPTLVCSLNLSSEATTEPESGAMV